MKMKVMNVKNLDKFFGVIDQCEGKVELVTKNGDIYNLKSKLSQYVTMAKIFFCKEIPEIELISYEPTDTKRIIQYMMES